MLYPTKSTKFYSHLPASIAVFEAKPKIEAVSLKYHTDLLKVMSQSKSQLFPYVFRSCCIHVLTYLLPNTITLSVAIILTKCKVKHAITSTFKHIQLSLSFLFVIHRVSTWHSVSTCRRRVMLCLYWKNEHIPASGTSSGLNLTMMY